MYYSVILSVLLIATPLHAEESNCPADNVVNDAKCSKKPLRGSKTSLLLEKSSHETAEKERQRWRENHIDKLVDKTNPEYVEFQQKITAFKRTEAGCIRTVYADYHKGCKHLTKKSLAGESSLLVFFTNGRLANQICTLANLLFHTKMLKDMDNIIMRPYIYKSQLQYLTPYFESKPILDAVGILDEEYCDPCTLEWNHYGHLLQKLRLDPEYVTGHGFSKIGYDINASGYKVILADLMSNVLRFRANFTKLAEERIAEFVPAADRESGVVLVGVHVRRTDYAGIVKSAHKGEPPKKDYFEMAMNYFRAKYKAVKFLVCSDDMKWVQKNLVGDDVVYIGTLLDSAFQKRFADRPLTSGTGVDLRVLSMCDHTIISYGTYGVWSALFAGGEAIMADNFAENVPGEVSDMKRAALPGWKFIDVKTMQFIEGF